MTAFDWTISDTPLPCKSYVYEIIHVTYQTRYKSYAYEMKAFDWAMSDTPLPCLTKPSRHVTTGRSSVAKRVFYNMVCSALFPLRALYTVHCIIKTHVRGFFDTDLHEVSWHFATHEAVRLSRFLKISVKEAIQNVFLFLSHN